MAITLIATITPLPEHFDAVKTALLEAIPQVHTEPGCLLYSLHEADGELLMIESWADTSAIEGHNTGTALASIGAAIAGKIAEPPVVRMFAPVPAGDPVRGSLPG